jgi:hypothetical protein
MGKYERHGMSGSKEHWAWMHMKKRCQSQDPKIKRSYTDRGIKVAPIFKKSFTAFYREIGPAPGPEYTVDRIDNDKGYDPGNLRWALPRVQTRNKTNNVQIEWQGQTWLLCDLAAANGIHQKLLRTRLAQGMPLAKALIPRSYYKKGKLKKYD